jgi:hypothetical protein
MLGMGRGGKESEDEADERFVGELGVVIEEAFVEIGGMLGRGRIL